MILMTLRVHRIWCFGPRVLVCYFRRRDNGRHGSRNHERQTRVRKVQGCEVENSAALNEFFVISSRLICLLAFLHSLFRH